MEQKDHDALDAWLIEHGNDVVTWDIPTRLEALSWIRSLRRPDPLAPEHLGRRRAPGWGGD